MPFSQATRYPTAQHSLTMQAIECLMFPRQAICVQVTMSKKSGNAIGIQTNHVEKLNSFATASPTAHSPTNSPLKNESKHERNTPSLSCDLSAGTVRSSDAYKRLCRCGHFCAVGFVLIVAFRKRSCPCIWRSSSSFTTLANAAPPSSNLSLKHSSIHQPGTGYEPLV